MTPPNFSAYKPWFYAAAIYNFVWGVINILFPRLLFDLLGMTPVNYSPVWQVVGMFVMVYGLGYYWAARDPLKFRHYILLGFLGKLFGPLGFIWSASTGQLPLVFGLTLLTNDLIWWPSFILFLRQAAKVSGGWLKLLNGD